MELRLRYLSRLSFLCVTCVSLPQNYKRVAVVWMGEYAEAIYNKNPRLRTVDPGDVSKEIEVTLIRIHLHR